MVWENIQQTNKKQNKRMRKLYNMFYANDFANLYVLSLHELKLLLNDNNQITLLNIV